MKRAGIVTLKRLDELAASQAAVVIKAALEVGNFVDQERYLAVARRKDRAGIVDVSIASEWGSPGYYVLVAQLVERSVANAEVAGSFPV